MYVLDQGAGPAIVLVPGLGCDHTMYRPQIESLEGVRCLAVDLRGCGRSPSLTDVSDRDVLAVQADDIADALADRHIQRAHLVGISYGGVVVQEFMLRHPELAQSAVICDSLCDVRPRSLRERLQLWPAKAQPLALRTTPRRLLAGSTRFAYRRWPAAGQAMADVFLNARMDDLVKQRRVVNQVQYEEALRASLIPTLSLVGAHSRLAIGLMRRVHQALPNSAFQVIPDSFDPSSLCNPEAFTAHLNQWVAAQESP